MDDKNITNPSTTEKPQKKKLINLRIISQEEAEYLRSDKGKER